MRITREGQVTIPREIRETAGLTQGSEVEFHYEDGRIWLIKSEDGRPQEIRNRLEQLRGSATANRAVSTDEWMRLSRGDD